MDCHILIHHEIPSGKDVIGNWLTIQNDNDPKHAASAVIAYLDRKAHSGMLSVMG